MDEQARVLAARTPHARLIELDSLRGLAAFIVIWHHFSLLFGYDASRWTAPFLSGRESVTLFFALSGFVLSLPFWEKGTTGRYRSFVTRRLCRIYLPYAAAVTLALPFAWHFLFARLPLNSWFYYTWQTPLTSKFILEQYLMYPSPELNTAFWSLHYEMEMSLLFPFLLLLMRRLGTRRSLALAFLSYLLGACIPGHLPNPWFTSQVLQYGSIFLLGALLARHRDRVSKWLRGCRPMEKAAFLMISATGYFYARRLLVHVRIRHHTLLLFGDLVCACGACGLIVAAFSLPRMSALLRHQVPEYLGRISYSLYLVHGTVLFTLANLLYGKISVIWFGTIFFVTSMGLSHLFCIWIEEPSMRFGKRLTVSAHRST